MYICMINHTLYINIKWHYMNTITDIVDMH